MLEKHAADAVESAKEIAKSSSSEIITYLTISDEIVPTYQSLVDAASDPKASSVFLDLIPVSPIDQSGNTPEHFVDDEEKARYKILTQYNHAMRLRMVFIRAVFLEVSKAGKLSYDIMYEHLKSNSWLGRPITLKSPSGNEVVHNWLDQVSPSLFEYFYQIDHSIQSGTKYPNLVLCIDSLTLKLEGILRDICTITKIPTFYQVKDRKGRDVTREKDINALLHEDKVVELLPIDDLQFLRYVLVEKMGFNLRHKVAHCLLNRNEYVLEYIHLLILCLLKLGNFVSDEKKFT